MLRPARNLSSGCCRRWHSVRVARIEGLSLFQVGQFGQSRAFSSAINEWLAGIKKSAPVADSRKGVMVRIAQCDKIEMAVADSWSVAQLKICPRLPCNFVKGVWHRSANSPRAAGCELVTEFQATRAHASQPCLDFHTSRSKMIKSGGVVFVVVLIFGLFDGIFFLD